MNGKLKFLSLIMLMVLSALSLASCGSDDDDNGNFASKASFNVQSLYGTWKMDQYSSKGTNYVETWFLDYPTTYISFDDDGTFSTQGMFGSYTTDYSINGYEITLNPDLSTEYDYIKLTVLSLTSADLKIKVTVASENDKSTTSYFIFKKQ